MSALTKFKKKIDFKKMQKLSMALMLPIAILPAAGFILAIGTSFDIPLLAKCGGAVFDNLALLFAIGIAVGLTEDGSAALSAIVGYFFLQVTMGVHLGITSEVIAADNQGRYALVLGIPTLQTGVFGGMIVGFMTFFLFKKFYKAKLPEFLSFFGGKRFVPMVTALAAMILGFILPVIWIPVQDGLSSISQVITASGSNAGLTGFIYGLVERALIPFGLHHIWNVPFYYNFGEYTTSLGQFVTGDIPVFFAQLADNVPLTSGLFMTGRFPIMMFGLPAAALAMYHEAKDKNRTFVKGLLLSGALTSFATGITEPLEFAFMFAAPLLYIVHCFIYATSFALMSILNVHIGHPFAGGLIDFVLNGVLPNRTAWWWVIVAGVGYAVIYYCTFRFLIRKFNLKTPGREEEETVEVNTELEGSERAKNILQALGGAENIESLTCCATRLRCSLKDDNNVDEKRLKELGARGLIKLGNGGVQVIFGGMVNIILEELKELNVIA